MLAKISGPILQVQDVNTRLTKDYPSFMEILLKNSLITNQLLLSEYSKYAGQLLTHIQDTEDELYELYVTITRCSKSHP